MPGPTVLLLDDDPNTLLVLRAVLEGKGAEVLESLNEATAVRHCQERSGGIDVLVADVMLQDTDGPAVVRRVKYLQPQMRLLFISGFGIDELGSRGVLDISDLAAEYAGFLQKPFTAEDFVASVYRLVGSRTN